MAKETYSYGKRALFTLAQLRVCVRRQGGISGEKGNKRTCRIEESEEHVQVRKKKKKKRKKGRTGQRRARTRRASVATLLITKLLFSNTFSLFVTKKEKKRNKKLSGHPPLHERAYFRARKRVFSSTKAHVFELLFSNTFSLAHTQTAHILFDTQFTVTKKKYLYCFFFESFLTLSYQ